MNSAGEQEKECAEAMYAKLYRANGVGIEAHPKQWKTSLINNLRLFELFRKSIPEFQALLPFQWHHLPAEVLCSQDVYTRFTNWLALVYKHKKTLENPSGEFLKTNCVINYSSTMIHLGKALHGNSGTDATNLFFDCLTEGSMSEPAMWLRTLKQKIHRFLYQRAMNAGECG